MKHIFFVILFSAFSIAGIFAQGIYQTAADFENKNLSYTNHVIRADVAFNSSVVKVAGESGKLRLSKAGLYGFRDKNNQDIRFFNNANYRIKDTGGFYLYSRIVNVSKGKAKTRETKYYFSRNAGAPLTELTRYNLKKAFAENRNFHDLLDLQFRTDRELMAYDSFHGEYKLKEIFNKTINQQL